jgi:1-deoxy-D-xylulose-5-phosphate reductoisomerase
VRHEAFPAFGLGVAAGRAGGTAPAIFNAANEVAVAAFLEGRIRFGRIPAVIEQALARATAGRADSLDAIRGADAEARRHAGEAC